MNKRNAIDWYEGKPVEPDPVITRYGVENPCERCGRWAQVEPEPDYKCPLGCDHYPCDHCLP